MKRSQPFQDGSSRDCPECRARGTVIQRECIACLAEFGDDQAPAISVSTFWDLDQDEDVLGLVDRGI